eukprot:5330717-Lingulodinium_polyedra.AAC.1
MQSEESQDWLANIQQEEGFSRAGKFFPCMLRNSDVWSDTHRRAAFGKEHLVAQGIAAFSFLPKHSHDRWHNIDQHLSESAM